MRKVQILFLLLVIACIKHATAATVDTVATYSQVMHKTIKAVVITPAGYSTAKQYAVVYLLHGYGGNYADWATKTTGLDKTADQLGLMIVCPDGGIGSWYWDSPVDTAFKYETYVSRELVSWIDSKYSTIKDRKGRGITGLSMGGHGALYLALKHQDVYGVAGSMSGGVDFRPFPNNWDIAKRLGKYADQPERWEKNTVINMLHLLTPNALALAIECGTEDFFYRVNEQLHQQLMYRNIAHDYTTRPGAHNFAYWNNAVQYQLLFMNNYFTRGR